MKKITTKEATTKTPQPQKKSTESSTSNALTLEAIQELLAPLLTFHAAVADAAENDLRLYWDVRLVKGKNTAFAHVKGSSSMPGMLSDGRIAESAGLIQSEIMEKIAKTVTAKLQKQAEAKMNLGLLNSPDDYVDPGADTIEDSAQDLEGHDVGDMAMKHAND